MMPPDPALKILLWVPFSGLLVPFGQQGPNRLDVDLFHDETHEYLAGYLCANAEMRAIMTSGTTITYDFKYESGEDLVRIEVIEADCE